MGRSLLRDDRRHHLSIQKEGPPADPIYAICFLTSWRLRCDNSVHYPSNLVPDLTLQANISQSFFFHHSIFYANTTTLQGRGPGGRINTDKNTVCRDGMELLLQKKIAKRKAWWQDCPLAVDKLVQFDFFNASAHSLALYCPEKMLPSISLAPSPRGLVRVVPLLVFKHVPFF